MNSISSLIHKFFVLAAAVLDKKDYWIQKVRRSGWKESRRGAEHNSSERFIKQVLSVLPEKMVL